MNILFYTDYAISTQTGGIGRITSILANRLRRDYGYKVYSIYAFDVKNDVPTTETDGSIRLRLHDKFGWRRSVRKNYPKAAVFIREHEVDVVIIQTSMDVAKRLRYSLLKIGYQTKIITELHYEPGKDENSFAVKKVFSRGSVRDKIKAVTAPVFNLINHFRTIQEYRDAYYYGDQLVLLSKLYIKEYQDYARITDSSKFKIIYNCLSFDEYATKDEVINKKKTVLFVGRMAEYPKRMSEILLIWNKIEQKSDAADWNLVMVGDGHDLSDCKRLAEQLGLQRVFFVGRANPEPYYRQSSIFMMTSIFEGFPMTLLECEQMGCVPICWNSFPTVTEAIQHGKNGIVVDNNDRELFAKELLKLMNDEAKRLLMAESSIEYSKHFSQDNMVKEWEINLKAITSHEK